MVSYAEASNYQLGLVPTQMATLRNMRIAPPDQVVYRPASVYYVRSDFSRVGDGFASVEWVWDTISIARLSKILELLGGQEYVYLYVVTDKRMGLTPNPKAQFALFSAIMWKPILSGEEGVPVAKSPYVMQTVKLQFINMVEQAGYL